jgi:hypothetical protein
MLARLSAPHFAFPSHIAQIVTRLKITDSKSVYVGQTAARAASSTSIMKSASALVMHKGGLIRRVFA